MAHLKKLLVLGFLLMCLAQAGASTQTFPPPTGSCPTATPAPQATVGVSDVSFTNTALTNGSYVTAASPSIALGVSTGTVGAWRVVTIFYFTPSSSISPTGCIEGTAAGTNIVVPVNSCNGSPANALSGEVTALSSANLEQYYYAAQYANSTTVAFTCQIKIGTIAQTATGHCREEAFPI